MLAKEGGRTGDAAGSLAQTPGNAVQELETDLGMLGFKMDLARAQMGIAELVFQIHHRHSGNASRLQDFHNFIGRVLAGPSGNQRIQLGAVLPAPIGIDVARIIGPFRVAGSLAKGTPVVFRAHGNSYPGIVPRTPVVVMWHHRGMAVADGTQDTAIHYIIEVSLA